jgi:hypothetical protein
MVRKMSKAGVDERLAVVKPEDATRDKDEVIATQRCNHEKPMLLSLKMYFALPLYFL